MLKHILFFAFLIISGFAQAQQNRYMVFFSDKANTHHQINEPLSFLSAKAIERRQKQSISITVDDLPVSQAYVQSIKQLGVDVFFTSRWFNAALIQAEADQLTDIQNLAFVSQIEFVAPGERLIRNGRKKLEEDVEDTDLGTTSAKQLIQLGMGEMHADQYKGEGVNIAVIDGGFLGVDQHEYFALMRDQGRLKDTFNFVSNTNNPFSASQHGSMVLSAMAAYKSSDFIGGAYMANYYLYLTEDAPTEYRVEEYNWLFAAERADSAGVDIINTSLGYSWFDDSSMDYTPADMDGQTAVISIAAKMAFDRGMLVVTSAGNYGNNNWQVITAPADVEEVIAVGAVTDTGLRAAFSSKGPSADNRIKPDMMAMGLGAAVITSSGQKASVSGTSLSSPLLASLAAGIWQAYPMLSNYELREALIKSSDRADNPDNLYGYGIPNYQRAMDFIREKYTQKLWHIYPNPSDGREVYIRTLTDINSQVNLQVINTAGQTVRSYRFSTANYYGRFTLELTDLQKGMYIFRFTSNEGVQSIRWIKN